MIQKSILCALALATAMAPMAVAQNIDDAVELGRKVIETERQVVAAASIQLTQAESAEFWPVYREYQTAIARVDDRFVDLIERATGTMTEKQAKSMVYDYFAIEESRLKIRKKYFKKFRKIAGETKAARFVQIENKMDAIIRFALASEIPLVR